MTWVTREHANIDRIACPWLIKCFIDPQAQFIFVPRDEVPEVAERLGAKSFDAEGADFSMNRLEMARSVPSSPDEASRLVGEPPPL